MDIFDYFDSGRKTEWRLRIAECDWSAARFLARLLEADTFVSTLGGGRLLICADGDTLCGFVTLTPQDCIADKNLTPWAGFLWVSPQFRGNRLGGQLLSRAAQLAADNGHDYLWLATDHTGLYEKYGFEYVENRVDVWGDDSRIYRLKLSPGKTEGK